MRLYANITSEIPLTSARESLHSRRRARVLRIFRRAPRFLHLTPDPRDVEALERKRAELNYTPECGFHRDRVQERIAR